MPSNLGRNLHLCFSKLRLPNQSPSPPSPPPTAKDHDHNHDHPPTTVSSNLMMMKNFNSLYDLTTTTSAISTSNSLSLSRSRSSDFFSSSSDSEETDPTTTTSPPDFATLFSSQRFFFSFPGRSNSIFDSSRSSSSSYVHQHPSPDSDHVVAGGVPFHTYSPDPFSDFRRSMQEMVEARGLFDVRANWEGLHELLSCYLDLNPNKHIHKFIIGAFADLLLSLASTSDDAAG